MNKLDEINKEEWRAVVGFEGQYEVSNFGNVRSLDRISYAVIKGKRVGRRLKGKNIKLFKDKHGYLNYMMNEWTYKVHSVVALAFLGPRPDGMIVCHWDDDGGNNHVSNLRYATYSENLRDAVRNKKMPHLGYSGNGRRKLTKKQCDYIRSFPYENGLYEKLGRELGVYGGTVARIYRGLGYKDV